MILVPRQSSTKVTVIRSRSSIIAPNLSAPTSRSAALRAARNNAQETPQ
ncbi:hypothetical protein GGR94_003296 [Sulfitobacter geojensis]|nr:hypothetical protein [Sulfitobacter geojensis]